MSWRCTGLDFKMFHDRGNKGSLDLEKIYVSTWFASHVETHFYVDQVTKIKQYRRKRRQRPKVGMNERIFTLDQWVTNQVYRMHLHWGQSKMRSHNGTILALKSGRFWTQIVHNVVRISVTTHHGDNYEILFVHVVYLKDGCYNASSIDNFITCFPKSHTIKSTTTRSSYYMHISANKFMSFRRVVIHGWHWHIHMGDLPLLEIKKGGGHKDGVGWQWWLRAYLCATAKGITKGKKRFLSKLRARSNWAGSFISPNTDA